MGADSFVAFYGIKIAVDPDDDDMHDALGSGADQRCKAASFVGLQTHFGRMTNGEDYFLYVGQRIGWLGLEHDKHVQVLLEKFTELAARVDARLKEAGFREIPELHLQFVGQH